MTVIGWIFFGLLVGIVGKLLMPGKDPSGFIVTVAIGIVGALIGGFLGRLFGLYGPDDPVGFVMAVIGAMVLLWIYRLIVSRTAS
ncbi:MAG: GlsB/YeaQ/YmgE family stress response membrane protein [Chloroflexota bacterium]